MQKRNAEKNKTLNCENYAKSCMYDVRLNGKDTRTSSKKKGGTRNPRENKCSGCPP